MTVCPIADCGLDEEDVRDHLLQHSPDELVTVIIGLAHGAAPEPLPRRGDQAEQWLKAQRDQHGWHGSNDQVRFNTIDRMLGDYQLHADTRTPLGGCHHVFPAFNFPGQPARGGGRCIKCDTPWTPEMAK